MPEFARKSHLLAYDIADPRRLGRVHRYMKKRAIAVQYSVFLVECSPLRLKEVIAGVQSLLDEREDDVRVYTLPSRIEVKTMGNQLLPGGIDLLAIGVDSYVQYLS